MKKRMLITLITFLVFGILVAGCGTDKEKETQSNTSNNSKTITVVSYNTEGTVEWLEEVKEDFIKEHPDATVNVEPIKSSGGDFFTKLSLMLSSDSAPEVFLEDTFRINDDALAGYLEPLIDRVESWDDWENFNESVKKGVTAVDGNIYGIPFNTDIRGLWYNTEIFEEAGITTPWKPASWGDVLNTARTIKENVPDVTPLWFSSSKAEGEATAMDTFQMLLTGTKDTLYNSEDQKWVGQSEGFKDSLDFIQTVYSEELGPELSEILNAQAANSLLTDYMPANKVGISLNGNWVPRQDGTESYEFTPMPTKEGQAPKYTSMSGGWTFSIAKKAKNKDLAWEFIKMATDKSHNKDYILKMKDLTPRTDLADDKEILSSIRGYKEALNIVKYTNYRPAVENYSQVSASIQEAVESVVVENAEPISAMEKYEDDLKRIVGEEKVVSH